MHAPFSEPQKQAAPPSPPAPVLLQPAVRLVRQRAFDHVGIQCWLEVVLAEGGPLGEAELFHAFQRAGRLAAQALEQGFDLVGDLIADLVGRSGLPQCHSCPRGPRLTLDETHAGVAAASHSAIHARHCWSCLDLCR